MASSQTQQEHHRNMFEGVGAPVKINEGPSIEIDPTLDSCCQREIESNQKRSALETTLRAHDPIAKAETQRRQQHQQIRSSGYNYKSFNLIHGLSFGSGCRCCYDPNDDGGEYELLTEARKEKLERERGEKGSDSDEENGQNEANNNQGQRSQQYDDTHDSDSDSDSDSEFDYLLDEDLPSTNATLSNKTDSNTNSQYSQYYDMQSERRAELELLAQHYEVVRHHGYGVHRQMHPRRLFASVGYVGYGAQGRQGRQADQADGRTETNIVPRGAVLHLYDPHSPISASLDLILEDMAPRYPGTKFVRGMGITSLLYAEDGGGKGTNNGRVLDSYSSSRDWKKGDLPMLLALRDGRVVAWSEGLRDFYDSSSGRDISGDRDQFESVEPRVVEQWLDRAGVLIDAPPPMEEICRIRPEEEALLENMMKLQSMGVAGGIGGVTKESMRSKGGQDDFTERYDCGVEGCSKSFYHEHVGVKNEMQDGLLVSESKVASSNE